MDIVERLKYWAFKFCGKGRQEDQASDVMTAAAAEIERWRVVEESFVNLMKDNVRLREALKNVLVSDDAFQMAIIARDALNGNE